MKIRISKKLHLRDYAEYGTLVKLTAPHNDADDILDRFGDIVERHGLCAWGGNSGVILTPKVKDSYIIPAVIEQFVIGMMSVEDDGTMAFIVHKPAMNADMTAFVADVKAAFNEVRYQLKVFTHVDLWRKAKK